MVFTHEEPLPGGPGYVSDHVGLRASLVLAPSSVVESGAPGCRSIALAQSVMACGGTVRVNHQIRFAVAY